MRVVRGWTSTQAGSLWLLPSGPDQIGEALARANLSILHIGALHDNGNPLVGSGSASRVATFARLEVKSESRSNADLPAIIAVVLTQGKRMKVRC